MLCGRGHCAALIPASGPRAADPAEADMSVDDCHWVPGKGLQLMTATLLALVPLREEGVRKSLPHWATGWCGLERGTTPQEYLGDSWGSATLFHTPSSLAK